MTRIYLIRPRNRKRLGWALAFNPVETTGPVGREVEQRCYELGATVAANLL